jgi:flavin-dependent dehydrogenase
VADRASFPSDTMSTHYIQQDGVARLRAWGLLDAVVAAGTPPIPGLTLDFGDFRVPVPAPPGEPAYCPRRTVLDKILVDAAVAAGAELRERFSVQDVLVEDGRVAGIRGRAAGGANVEERARIVIGADGRHSVVARAVRAEDYNVRPALTCGYYSYWSGVPLDGAEIALRPGRGILLFPTNDGLTCMGVECHAGEFEAFRADIDGTILRSAALVPGLAERVAAGRREERYQGGAEFPNYFRKPYGPGWALVGDAGYLKDPVTGTGISDAFRDAELLAKALDAGLAGREPLDRALAGYEQRRNEAAFPMYEVTCRLAEFRPPDAELFQLFGNLPQPQAAG